MSIIFVANRVYIANPSIRQQETEEQDQMGRMRMLILLYILCKYIMIYVGDKNLLFDDNIWTLEHLQMTSKTSAENTVLISISHIYLLLQLLSLYFQNFYRAYTDPAVDRVAFRGVTYCIKSRNSNQMICFNGNKYMIMNRTQKLFILTYCVSKQKSVLVAEWINTVAKKLKERQT